MSTVTVFRMGVGLSQEFEGHRLQISAVVVNIKAIRLDSFRSGCLLLGNKTHTGASYRHRPRGETERALDHRRA